MKAAKREREEREERKEEHEKRRRGGGIEKKRRDHEKRAAGGSVVARARGGGVREPSAAPTAENYPDPENMEERGHKRIRVVKRHGGKVDGKKAARRVDKRARGGRMTPKEPLSGAQAPNLAYAKGAGPESKPEGAGKERG